MKLALLLFGSSICEYLHFSNKIYIVNYKYSYKNYKEYIFNYFKKKDYDIDTYFSTNLLDDNNKEKLCNCYKPVKCNFIKNKVNNQISRKEKIIDVIKLCLQNDQNYDLVLITRFDLIFKKKFDKSNIQFDKFNLVSILEKKDSICDNFYLFPYKYLNDFLNILKTKLNHHVIQTQIYEKFGEESVNYILNEKKTISKLSFYKIYRQEKKFKRKNKELIINKLDNNTYFNRYSLLNKISTNSFYFSKDTTYSIIPCQWCGFKINPKNKSTLMKFDIIFFLDIPCKKSNFYIKTHNPIKKYSDWICKCRKNEFVSIEINLELELKEQLILFFCDEYLPKIHFYVKNIEFENKIHLLN